jgi:phosphatidylserine decarboxylase
MTPFDVHINRSPIKGKIELMKHYRHKSLPMTKMWFRTIFKIEPYYKGSIHILENERVITRIKGELTCYIIQIADIAVNKISNWVRIGDIVTKGQRIGIIKMGSQVDIVLPASRVLPLIKVGQKVKAGETILAKAKFEQKKS